jgi:lysozyme
MTPRGLAMLKKAEGCKLTAYQDVGGVWTVGYGHTGIDIKAGVIVSQSQADRLLLEDVAKAEQGVNNLVTVPLSAGQMDCLIAFVFNTGQGAFKASTLLRELNAGHYESVPAELRKWVHINGRESPGLVARRESEIKLWLALDY